MEEASRSRLAVSQGAPIALLAAYLIALSLLAISAFIDYRNARQLESSTRSVSRTLEALEKIRQIGNVLFVAESSQRGFILTGQTTYIDVYRDMQQRMPLRLSELDGLVSETEAQRAAVVQLRAIAQQRFAEMERPLTALAAGDQQGAIAQVRNDQGINSLADARELIRTMLAVESRLLGDRRAVAANAYASGQLKALSSSGVVALALTVFYFLMRRYLGQRDAAQAALERSNAELEQRVAARTADLSQLSRHLLNVRENEKKTIARDLHDEFGSYLTAINMDVSRARDKIAASNPEQASKLDRTLGLLGNAIEMKRRLISELRPSMLDNLGLGAALEQYIDEWSRFTGIPVDFDHSGELESDVDGCLIAIFRVFQEALNNIAKHSGASAVRAHVHGTADVIEIEIADNGIGMPEAAQTKSGTNGLLGIRERILAYHGSLELLRGPKGGTVLRASVPCGAGNPAAVRSAVPALA